MSRQRLLGGGAAASALLTLLTAGPASAQYADVDRPSQMTVGRSFYSSAGPGYTYYLPSTSRPWYGFYPGYYTGYPIPGRFTTNQGYYSQMAPSYSPIMLTSINYPGIYGSFVQGLTPSGYNVTPTFATRVYNPPSAAPVGMPYVASDRETLGDQPATLEVNLPADAVLEVEGQPTRQTGAHRVFESPPLVPFRDYSYDLRARWTVGDQEVVQTRHVRVAAGQRVEVSLAPGARAVEEPATPSLRTAPLRRTNREPPR
jgi:uncharacterized protein (TIGR03000 family)